MSTGYLDIEIVDLVIAKSRRIDPSLFAIRDNAYLATLGASSDNVLDFGGGAGFHYNLARYYLPARRFRWAIVEMPEMVKKTKEFETDDLRFFVNIDDAVNWLGVVDLVHSNSAVQYLDEPEAAVEQLLRLSPVHVFWGRMMLASRRTTEIQTAMLSEHGPGPTPAGFADRLIEHQIVRMSGSHFDALHSGYDLVWRGGNSSRFRRKM